MVVLLRLASTLLLVAVPTGALSRSLPTTTMSAVPSSRPAWTALSKQLQSITHLGRARAVLEWDQLVMMPHADDASAGRGAQISALASVLHEKETSPTLLSAIEAAESEDKLAGEAAVLSEEQRIRATIREAKRSFEMEAKLSAELAERRAALGSEAYNTWNKARTANDFSMFEETLDRCFKTVAEVANARGTTPDADLYSTCLDEYERGMEAGRIEELFGEVEAQLQPLIQKVLASTHAPTELPLTDKAAGVTSPFPIEAQEQLSKEVVNAMGFPDGRRIDVSVHPFTTSFGPADVRITSRFREDEWYQGLAGSVHECGHALYESQLRDTGLPLDTAMSMGVHESQSLFWERHVGLSRSFWTWCGPRVREILGSEYSDGELYGAVNRVTQGLIRVEADELTYPMHVILRYRLEAKLLRGELPVSELPSEWRRGMKELLGVDGDTYDDDKGCLQDVHWSGLAVGYFPTYLLGAMMAAQLDHFIRHDAVFAEAQGGRSVDELIEAGDFAPFKAWLKEKIHDHGSLFESMDELLMHSFGEPLNPKYFIDYLTTKYEALYQLEK